MRHLHSRSVVYGVILLLSTVCIHGAALQGSEYGGSVVTFDPQGRLHQVEYAYGATTRGGVSIGATGVSCCVLGSCKPVQSSRKFAQKMIWDVDTHVGLTATGLSSDVHHMANTARRLCSEYRHVWGGPIPCIQLARRLAEYTHAYTRQGGYRPLAIDMLIGGVGHDDIPCLYHVTPSGSLERYTATAVGSNSKSAIDSLITSIEHTEIHTDACNQQEHIHVETDNTCSSVKHAGQDTIISTTEHIHTESITEYVEKDNAGDTLISSIEHIDTDKITEHIDKYTDTRSTKHTEKDTYICRKEEHALVYRVFSAMMSSMGHKDAENSESFLKHMNIAVYYTNKKRVMYNMDMLKRVYDKYVEKEGKETA